MLKQLKADLHIHSCLSPCADLKMTPSGIVKKAIASGINIITISDHNSAENVMAVRKAAEGTGLTVLAGMEITSSEEAHILAVFNDIDAVIKLQDIVYENLLPGENDERRIGYQVVVNEKDEVLKFNNRLLITATRLTVSSLIKIIHSLGGLSIACHVDKHAFSIISQLGFIPEDLMFDALEFSPKIEKGKAMELFKDYTSFSWVSSSDAHYLEDIGKRTTNFFIKEPTIVEMASAMKNIGSRRVEWGKEPI